MNRLSLLYLYRFPEYKEYFDINIITNQLLYFEQSGNVSSYSGSYLAIAGCV